MSGVAMAFLRLLTLVSLLGASFAGPIPSSESSICASKCPVSDIQKLQFVPGKSYEYTYTGTSKVTMAGPVPAAVSKMDWKAKVVLNWLSACQVEVKIQDPVVVGHEDNKILPGLLAQKSMIASIKDGVVVGVCADKDDHPAGLNMKKGVLSAIQNVLPALSTEIVNKTFVENDILGRCPTTYNVSNVIPSWVVTKQKNHKDCSGQHATADESPVRSWWLKSPLLPLNESHSECTQVISKDKRLMTSVTCVDKNIVVLMEANSMTAVQKTELKLIKVAESVPTVMTKYRQTNLTFEVVPEPTTPLVIPEVKVYLKKVCDTTSKTIEKEAARNMAKLIALLYRVPESSVKEFLADIRKGVYCKNVKRLESLFLDAIAFVGNAGAVQVMVEEVTSGKVSGWRTPMYTLALHLLKKPCVHSVEAVEPLFSSSKVPSAMVIAAGSLVGKYCIFNPQCLADAPVKQIMDQLAKNIDDSCSASAKSQEKKVLALTSLKSVGNVANISQSLEQSVLKCVKSSTADTYVRVAATQAYRHASCDVKPIKELVKLALDVSSNTEVRIASYVAAITCASFEDSKLIVTKISSEANTQVRSFILSHLRNLQKSDAPYLRGVRYNLTSLVIPVDFDQNFIRHSRDVDLSYYLPSMGVGGGVETSVIFAPGSYLPRQLQTNITIDLFNNVINVGEFSIRMEHLENIIHQAFGPEGYFQKADSSKVKADALKQFASVHSKVKSHLNSVLTKSEKKSDLSSAPDLFTMFNGENGKSEPPILDTFARIFGQEVVFTSSSSVKQFDQLLDDVFSTVIQYLMEYKSMTRVLQFNLEYFVPTAQGVPLQLKSVGTNVMSLDLNQTLGYERSRVQLKPSMSLAVNSFIGYTLGAKSGIRNTMEASMNPYSDLSILTMKDKKVEVVFDAPEEFKLLDADVKNYMMNKMPSMDDQRLVPSQNYPKVNVKGCSSDIKSSLALDLCYELSGPDYTKAKIFPLGDAKAVIEIKKQNPSKPIVSVSGSLKLEEREKSIAMQLDAPGTKSAGKLAVELGIKKDSELQSIKLFGMGPSGKARVLQLNIKQKQYAQGRLSSIVAFYGKQKQVTSSDEVMSLSASGKKKGKMIETKFDWKTKKGLAKYIDVDIQVDIATNLDTSALGAKTVNIRKMELNVAVPKVVETKNFIRPVQPKSPETRYKIRSVTKTPSRTLLDVKGLSISKGVVPKRSFEADLSLTVKCQKNLIQSHSRMILTQEHKEVMLKLTRKGQIKPVLYANASIAEAKPSFYLTNAELEIPSLMKSVQLEGSATKKSRDYDVKIVLKRDNKPGYKIEGPVMLDMSKSALKANSELTINTLMDSKKFLIKMKTLLSSKKKNAMFAMRENKKTLFAVEGEYEQPSENRESVNAALTIPCSIDAKMKVDTTNSLSQLLVDGYLQPNTPESHKFMLTSSVDPAQKLVKAKLVSDANKGPKKTVGLTAHYDYSLPKKYASVKGEAYVDTSVYKYTAECILGGLSGAMNKKNDLRIRVIQPDHQEIRLESSCLIQNEGQSKSIVQNMLLKLSSEQEYKMNSKYVYDFSEVPTRMQLNGQTVVGAPELKNITVAIDSRVDIKEMDQEAIYKMVVSGNKLSKPIKVDINLMNKNEKSLKAKADITLGAAADASMDALLELVRNEQQAVKDLKIEMDLKLPKDKSVSAKATKSEKDLDMQLKIDGRKILAYEQSSPQTGSWVGKLTTPSRVVEAQSQLTKNTISASLYPNRRISESKFGLEGECKSIKSLEKSSHNAGIKISYPGSSKDLDILVKGEIGKDTSKGYIELDIFKDAQDKITVDVRSVNKSESSFKIEMDVKVPRKNIAPRIDIELALSPEVKMFDLQVRKSASAQVLYAAMFGLNQISDRNSNLFVSVRSPYRDVKMVSNIQKHELLQCRGYSVNGTVVSNGRPMDFASAICAPGYIEFGAKNGSDDKMYIAKVGMKNPTSLKVALDLVYNSSRAINKVSANVMESTYNLYGRHEYVPKIPMALVGAKLWSPKMLTMDVQYNVTGINEYINTVLEPTKRDMQEVYQELTLVQKDMIENIPQLPSELLDRIQKLNDTLSKEVSDILKEVGLELPSLKDLVVVTKEALKDALKLFKDLKTKVDELLQKVAGISFSDVQVYLKAVDQKLKDVLKPVYKDSLRIMAAVKSGQRKEMLKVPQLKWVIETVESSSIWDWVKNAYKHMREAFEKEWKAIEDTVKHYFQSLKDRIKAIYEDIMKNSVVQKIVKWIESWFGDKVVGEKPTLIGTLVTRFYSANMTEKAGLVRVQIPLRRPVSSLSAAVTSVGLSVPSGSSLSNIIKPQKFLQEVMDCPFSASGKLFEKNLVTYDGLVVPWSYSQCELLLTKALGDEVVVKKTDRAHTDLKVTLKTGKEFEMILEAGRPPSVPLLKNKRQVIMPGMNMTKVSEEEVIVKLKGMTLMVKRDVLEVKASPWTFSKMKGLMGNHDGEKGNDAQFRAPSSYHPSSSLGKHHLSKDSARELIERNRLDMSCRIPRA